jgi:hypothetical protein
VVEVDIMPNRWERSKEDSAKQGKVLDGCEAEQKIKGGGKSMPSKGDGYGSGPR